MSNWDVFGKPEYYDEHYFQADISGGKTFRRINGSVEKWGYYAKQKFHNWPPILNALKQLLHCETFLDVGCGCGSSLEWTRRSKLIGYGFDFTRWGTKNHLEGATGRIFCADARYIPVADQAFGLVFSSDLLEHIYLEDVDQVVDECYRASKRWVFHQIATAGMEDKPEGGYFLDMGKPIPLELEHYAVAGHVTVQLPEWWRIRLFRRGWEFREDLVWKFRRLVPESVIKFWRTIFILERKEVS